MALSIASLPQLRRCVLTLSPPSASQPSASKKLTPHSLRLPR